MSSAARTRRSSLPPSRRRARTQAYTESSYDDNDAYYSNRRQAQDEVTTNDAPAWESLKPRTFVSRRGPEEAYSSKKTTVIDFKAPSVKPSDSISRASARRRDRDRYDNSSRTNYSTRRTTASTRSRPIISRRHSSEDGSSAQWSSSRAAPLTIDNLENLNETNSEATRRSKRIERARGSSAGGGGKARVERWRRESGEETMYEGGGGGGRKSVYASSRREERFGGTEVVAAGAAAGAVSANAATTGRRRWTEDENASAARSRVTERRATADDYDNDAARSRVTSRRGASQVPPPPSSKRDLTVTRSNRQDLEVARVSPPSLPSEFRDPYDGVVTRRDESPPEMEWERRVRTRDYIRPSDGKWMTEQECVIRRKRAPQGPRDGRVDSVVQD